MSLTTFITLIAILASTIIGLAGNSSSPARQLSLDPPISSSLCDFVVKSPTLSQKEFNSTVGPWIQRKYSEWYQRNQSNQVQEGFWDDFRHTYAPTAPDSSLPCDLGSGTCEPFAGACHFINPKYSLEDQKNAYYAIQSVVNLAHQRKNLKEISTNKFNVIEAKKVDMMKKFSAADIIEARRKKRERNFKLGMHIAVGVLLIVGAVIGGIGGLIESTVMSFINTGIIGATVGILGLGANIPLDLANTKDYVKQITDHIATVQTDIHDFTNMLFDQDMLFLMDGQPGMTNHTLADLIGTGQYASHAKMTPAFEQRVSYLWHASWISNIWNTERAYIVMADAKNGCENDDRALEDLRVCLPEPEYKDKVFYIYFLSRVREGGAHQALVLGPPGWHDMPANITLEDVVKSSVAYYRDNGNTRSDSFTSDGGLDTFFGQDSALTSRGGRYAGIFTVPVCYSPDGSALSSINRIKSRNYPCMCADAPPWSKSSQNDKRALQNTTDVVTQNMDFDTPEDMDLDMEFDTPEDMDFGTPQDKSKSSGGYNSPTELFNFLNVTGLYKSSDWYKFCHKHMECKQDKSADFPEPFPTGAQKVIKKMHPWNKCDKPAPHDVKGCWDTVTGPKGRHNDGVHEAKCSNDKKVMELEQAFDI